MNLYALMQEQAEQLSKRVEELREVLKGMPEGSISCGQDHGFIRWIYHQGAMRKYIPRSDRAFAEKLSYKAYIQRLLHESEHELDSALAYIRKYTSSSPRPAAELISSPGHRELLAPYLDSTIMDGYAWQQEDYQDPDFYSGSKSYRTKSGLYVRSKSEILIADLLYDNHIYFRYECPINLDGRIYHPDFMIRHPKTGEILIWEHAGLMDEPEYRQRFSRKVAVYVQNGWLPYKNLILSYETMDQPFDILTAIQLLRTYILD